MMTALFALLLLAGDNPPATPPLQIRDVSVIDTLGGPTLHGRSVTIRDGKVESIAATDPAAVAPPGTVVVAGEGKFLIPGLWDMHVHLVRESGLALNLANGVTGLRVMWGFPALHYRWRKEIDEGTKAGPRLVVASNILDGVPPIWPGSLGIADAEAARKAVREAKAAGADFIKVYARLSPEAFRAIASEAKAVGLPFAGHVSSNVSAVEASDLKMASVEHLTGMAMACSPREAELFAARRAIIAEAKGDYAVAAPRLRQIETQARESFSPPLAAALFARYKANATWQCPTLSVLRALGSLDDPKFTADPRLKYVDALFRFQWDPKNDFRLKAMKPADFAAQRSLYAEALKVVGAMDRAGVPILAGTDEANPYIFPGFSLHDELGLLVEAGLSALSALQAATINPARFLGKESSLGSVAPGKVADLVLLDADPLASIANTRSIRAVVVRGKLLDRAALDALLKSCERPAPAASQP